MTVDGDQWVITLDMPRPPKGLHANDRTGWRAKGRATKQLRSLVFWKVMAAKVPQLIKCEVQVDWIVPDKRKRDDDGCDPMRKVIFDAIGSDRGVSAHVVPDDDPKHMLKPSLRIITQPGCVQHLRVTITEVLGDSA